MPSYLYYNRFAVLTHAKRFFSCNILCLCATEIPMAQSNKKQIPEPVRMALAIAAEFNAASGASDLKKSLPILAMKLVQSGADISEDILRDHASKGIEHIKQTANDLAKSKQKILSYDEIAARLRKEEKSEINNLDKAAIYGDLGWIKNHYKNGADITRCNDELLICTASHGHLDVVKYYVDNGANATAHNNLALRKAASNGNLEILKYLHQNDGDITVDDNEALRLAAKNGHLEVVKYCATHGGDITAINNEALWMAAENGHLEVLKYCSGNGINITAKDNYALRSAAENGHLDIVKYCADNGGDITAYNNLALRWAAENGHLEVVKYLYDNGGDISAHDNYALIAAAENSYLKIIKYLVDQGAPLSELSEERQNWYKENIPRFNLWQKLFNDDPPSGLIGYGARPECFKPDAFTSAVEWMKNEGYKGKQANQYAYNLSALFTSEDRILRYLDKWGVEGKKNPLHDLAQAIKIPKEGNLNLKSWGDAALKFGPEMAKFVKFADRLPKPEASLNKTREVIAEFAYERGSENKKLAAICLGYSVDDEDFEDALDFYQKHKKKGFKQKNIPDLKIDGAEFGKEGAKLYRLPKGDPRGLFLGEATDCCQSIGNVGRECAEHGFSSKNGGFYVVTDAKDKIIAQSWAWRGTNGEMVLDSLETLGTQLSTENWKLILEAMTKELAKSYPEIKGLYVGTGGATPSVIGCRQDNAAVEPIDYYGYRDSHKQHVISIGGKAQKLSYGGHKM